MNSTQTGALKVIFDIGGVLVDFSVPLLLQELSRISAREQNCFSQMWTDEVLDAVECGRISGEQCFMKYLKPLIPQWNYEDWIQAWMDNFSLNQTGWELFNGLHGRGREVYVLSNLAEYNMLAVQSKFPQIFHISRRNFFSYEIGFRKPDQAIFKQIVELLGCRPQECILIDDMEQNVQGAERAGLKGIVFNSQNLEAIKRGIDE